jgi:hypothetical protein
MDSQVGQPKDFERRQQLAPDSIVASVVASFQERSERGKLTYGVTLDRKDLSVLDWIQHTQEELMDAVLYLEKLKKTLTATQDESTSL